jgi:Virulence activator alpha C-term
MIRGVFVNPVVSPGAAWFHQIEDQRGMQLISATPYQNGVVGLYYRPSDPASAESSRQVGVARRQLLGHARRPPRREALRHEQRLQDYRARLLARGADNHNHPDFGAFATLKLALGVEELYAPWCRWLADQLDAGRTPRGRR